jgi:hypothetical protein
MYSSIVLDFSTRWRCMVSFTPLPIYPSGKEASVYIGRGWASHRVGLDAVDKTQIVYYWEFNLSCPACTARRYTVQAILNLLC